MTADSETRSAASGPSPLRSGIAAGTTLLGALGVGAVVLHAQPWAIGGAIGALVVGIGGGVAAWSAHRQQTTRRELESERDEARDERRTLALQKELLDAALEVKGRLLSVGEGFERVLEPLGAGLHADRVFLLQTYNGPHQDLRAVLLAEWGASAERGALVESAPRDFALSTVLPTAFRQLASGGEVVGPVGQWDSGERDFWDRQGVGSVALLPVRVDGRLWGVLGVEDRRTGRVWDPFLLGVLRSTADTLAHAQIRRDAELQALQQALHDPLTGLANRRCLRQRLQGAIDDARSNRLGVALLYLDLDRFKQINDTLGHSYGDRFLQFVARHRLTPCCGRRDLLARVGGDEFVLVLSGLEPSELVNGAAKVAESILSALSEPILLEGQELVISGSIGISRFPNDGGDAETLLKHADVAMYCAKEERRGEFRFYTARMNRTTQERFELEAELRHDLDPRYFKDDSFVLYFQPQVDVEAECLVGVESLVRWRHSRRNTMVPPGRFIPMAEETGLIQPLSVWVLRSACSQAARWAARGVPLRVAVNLSAHQLRSRDLLRQVESVLEQTQLPAHLLELEMTETALLTDVTGALDVMQELRRMGVFLSLDDFGAGYSSLSHLRNYPFQVVKIDRSFVKAIVGSSTDQLVVKALINLAKDLGMTVVAEGVEMAIQREILQRLGCHHFQGFLFSPPVSADELERKFLEPTLRRLAA